MVSGVGGVGAPILGIFLVFSEVGWARAPAGASKAAAVEVAGLGGVGVGAIIAGVRVVLGAVVVAAAALGVAATVVCCGGAEALSADIRGALPRGDIPVRCFFRRLRNRLCADGQMNK